MIDVVLLIVGLFLAHFIYEYIIRKPMLKDISKKYVLITGCDSGFGKALAKKLDSMGCPVFAACYTVKGAADLQQKTSSRLQTVQLDVTKEDSIKQAFNFVSSRIPTAQGLWGLVNNAGIRAIDLPLEFNTREDFQKVLDVNLLGMIDMCVTFLPLLKVSKGRIVNMSSNVGRISVVGNLPYPVSKWGVETFSDGLRMYTKQYDMHTSIIEPGVFKTELTSTETTRQYIQAGLDRLPEEYKNTVLVPDYVDKYEELLQTTFFKHASADLNLVVDAYIHGLFAVYPKKRYAVGPTSTAVIVAGYLPSWIQDYFGTSLLKKTEKTLHRKQ